MEKCLFNSESNNCCGYCKYHRANLTVRQMRTKECLQKQCRHLVKNENHSYWKQREVMKAKRKARKEMINERYIAVIGG